MAYCIHVCNSYPTESQNDYWELSAGYHDGSSLYAQLDSFHLWPTDPTMSFYPKSAVLPQETRRTS